MSEELSYSRDQANDHAHSRKCVVDELRDVDEFNLAFERGVTATVTATVTAKTGQDRYVLSNQQLFAQRLPALSMAALAQ